MLQKLAEKSKNKQIVIMSWFYAKFKRITSDRVYLCCSVPRQPRYKEIPQKWRAAGDSVSNLTGSRIEPHASRFDSDGVNHYAYWPVCFESTGLGCFWPTAQENLRAYSPHCSFNAERQAGTISSNFKVIGLTDLESNPGVQLQRWPAALSTRTF